jgi:hypothetical protein
MIKQFDQPLLYVANYFRRILTLPYKQDGQLIATVSVKKSGK